MYDQYPRRLNLKTNEHFADFLNNFFGDYPAQPGEHPAPRAVFATSLDPRPWHVALHETETPDLDLILEIASGAFAGRNSRIHGAPTDAGMTDAVAEANAATGRYAEIEPTDAASNGWQGFELPPFDHAELSARIAAHFAEIPQPHAISLFEHAINAIAAAFNRDAAAAAIEQRMSSRHTAEDEDASAASDAGRNLDDAVTAEVAGATDGEAGDAAEPGYDGGEITVSTDKADYAPGETAIITVSGLEEGATVVLEVDHVADRGADGVLGTLDDEIVELGGSGHDPFAVTDGGAEDLDGAANGSISATWHVDGDDSAGAEFRVTAADGETGEIVASAGFTDATNFVEKTLTRADGQPISNISHMEFGPDGLLYASSLFGTVYAFDIEQTPAGDYVATLVHEIDALMGVQNHNDDGTQIADVGRFVLGFDVVGTASDPIIYITHNDPRINTFADSNSGTLSQLQMNASGEWEKVDLVRGLPRSQHDHLLNDVEYIDDGTGNPYLLVSTGGNTNAGAPSDPLQYLPEYVLSGAILKIDLNTITSMGVKTDVYGQDYYYNLPTLDDPTRAGVNEGVDASIEIYGGNGGLNQAKYDPTGPVTFYAFGLRNAVEILQTESGALLTFDNGGNPSWGNTAILGTDSEGNTIATNLPNDDGSITTNQDQMHLIVEGAYFGHPNPFRASGHLAGLYDQDGLGTPLPLLPSDFETLIAEGDQDFQQAFFLAEGTEDGAIALSSKSSNGMAEYTFADAFDGALAGSIFVVRYGTNSLARYQMTDADGDGLPESGVKVEEYSLGIGGPLDVLAPQDGQPFFGTLFISGLVQDGAIRILEPGDGTAGVDPTDRDEDNIADVIDPFAYDPDNGQNTVLTQGATLFWDFESTTPGEDLPGELSGFRVGITGFMTNGSDLPEALSLDRFDPVILGGDDVVLGGTANTILIGATPDGTAEGAVNTQYHGFQAGFVPDTEAFTLTVETWNPFRSIAPADQSDEQRVGAALTTGSQDTFLALLIGRDYIELVHEVDGVEAARVRQTNPSINNVDGNVYLTDLIFDVDTVSGQVVARYEAQTLDGLITGSFEPIQLYGDLLDAVQGEYRIANKLSAPAWTLISTSGSAAPFEANWGSVTLEGKARTPGTGEVDLEVDAFSTFNSNAFTLINSGSVDISRLVLTIDDAFVDDVFWDSDGAGDGGGKAFTVDVEGGAGVTNADGVTSNPLPGANFYQTLTIDFADFNPGETVKFSIDTDPTSAAGLPGGSQMGDISGFEMTGTLVTVYFADGTWATGELFGTSITASRAIVNSSLLAPVELTINGLTNGQRGFVPEEQQLLELRGEPNSRVAVLLGQADTVPDDAFGEAIFAHPLDFNSIEGFDIQYVTLDASGFGSIMVNIVDPDPADPNDGITRIMAAQVDSSDQIIGRVGAGVTVKVGIDPGNFDPIAANDSDRISADETSLGNLLKNDFDADGDTIFVESVNGDTGNVNSTITLASGALLTVNADGSYTYDPNGAFGFLEPGQTAGDSFTYAISDGNGGTDTANVNLTIDGVAVKGDLVKAFNVNGPAYAAVDTNIFYEADPGISGGTVTLRNVAPTEITGTQDDPLYQRYAFGTFSYDILLASGLYLVELEMMEPWAVAPGQRVFDVEMEGIATGAFDNIDPILLSNGVQYEAITISAVVEVTDGVLDLDFLPSANNALVSAIAVFEVANAPDTVDLAFDDNATATEDGNVLIDVLANDIAGAAIVSVGTPNNGTAVIQNGQVLYTPNPDFSGTDVFTYTATDGNENDTAVVFIDVTGINDNPESIGLVGTTVVESAAAGAVIGTISGFDPDGDPITYTISDPNFAVNAAGQLVVASIANLTVPGNTAVPITITATDGNGGSATLDTSVTILDDPNSYELVAAINFGGGAYVAPNGTVYAADPGPSSGGATFVRNQTELSFAGTDNDPLYRSYRFADGALGGTSFSYQINVTEVADYRVVLHVAEPFWAFADQREYDVLLEGGLPASFDNVDLNELFGPLGIGTVEATVRVNDGVLNIEFRSAAGFDDAIAQAIEVYRVGGTSGPDFATDDTASIAEDDQVGVLIDVLANDAAGATIDSVASPSNGTAVIQNGEVLYTPDPDFSGVDSFIYTAADGSGGFDTATVIVEVTPVNDDPENIVLTGDSVLETALAGAVVGNITATDPDIGDVVSFSVDDPNFTVNAAGQLLVASGADLAVDGDTVVPITITATDGNGGMATLATTVTILDQDETDGPAKAVNVAGGALSAAEYQIEFEADPGPSGGSAVARNVNRAIAGTETDALFQSYRYGSSFSYDVALANGGYLVELYLVDPWANATGKRVFDVLLEGLTPSAFNDIDIFAAVGKDAALILTTEVTVTDGILDLDFIASTNNAIVSAFAIYEMGDLGPNTAPTIDPIANVTVDEGQAAAFSVTSMDADGQIPVVSVVVTRDADGAVVDPAEYSFTDNGDGTGDFSWATDGSDAGAYTATVTASDGIDQSQTTLALMVNDVPNAPPTIEPIADVTVDEGQAAQFAVTSTDADGQIPALSVVVTRDADGTVVDPADYSFTDNSDGTGNFSWATDSTDAGAYTATVTASDGIDQTQATFALTVNDVPLPGGDPALVAAVNVAGGALSAPEYGIDFAADPGLSGGSAVTRNINDQIAGTETDALFQSYRFGTNFSYDIALANGDYRVELYLVDPWANAEGKRLFDVQLEGATPVAFDAIDIFAAVGQDAAMIVSADVSVSDGVLDLDFDALTNNAIVSGFAIYDL